MERNVYFRPAFHLCTPDPTTSKGIGGVRIIFTLAEDGRGVQWELLTDWELPDEDFALAAPECTHPAHQQGPPQKPGGASAGAIIWHWPRPLFDHAPKPQSTDCDITGGRCWSDVGYMVGDQAFDALRRGGDEELWFFLAKCIENRKEPA